MKTFSKIVWWFACRYCRDELEVVFYEGLIVGHLEHAALLRREASPTPFVTRSARRRFG